MMEQYPKLQGRSSFFSHQASLIFFFRPPTSVNAGQKAQNPYYANPFFRPKIVTNQQSLTTTNTNLPPPSRESSIVTTNLTIQTFTSGSTTQTNRGRQPVLFKTPNPSISSNGRVQEPETTVNTLPTQDDNRRWAHTVASAPIAPRAINDERTNGILKSSEINVSHLNTNILSPFLF
jgi:hypothetical protein